MFLIDLKDDCALKLRNYYYGAEPPMKPLPYNFIVHNPTAYDALIFEGCGWNIQCSDSENEEIVIAFTGDLMQSEVYKLIEDGKALGKIF